MILCKECGELASWNPHFQKYMCSFCNWRGDKENPYKPIKTPDQEQNSINNFYDKIRHKV